MLIYACNLTGVTGVLDTYISCIWHLEYSGMGDFQIEAAATAENIAFLQEGTYLVREQDISGSATYRNIMVLESVKFKYDAEQGETIIVKGRGLKSILSRRIIWEQITDEMKVDLFIRKVITENAISPSISARAIPDLTLGAYPGMDEVMEAQVFSDNLADWIIGVCETYGIGWDIYITGGKYVFDIIQGTDRSAGPSPVVFSPSFDNLLSFDYSHTREGFKNAALVGGEGEGTSKRTASVGTASGLNRFEMYVDGSSVSSNGEIITLATYLNLLKQYGKEELAKIASSTEKFDADINTNGVYKMGVDFFLGDIVQVQTEHGITASSRLIETIESVSDNGTEAVGTFSEWEV
jgi:hypothetical protein